MNFNVTYHSIMFPNAMAVYFRKKALSSSDTLGKKQSQQLFIL